MSAPPRNASTSVSGRVFLLDDDPREPEIVFSFPVHDELNEAVRQLPGRWFDWRRKNWRVPAHPRLAKRVQEVLVRFPDLVPSREVLDWLSDSALWRAVVSPHQDEHGAGVFLLRTLSGDPPTSWRGRSPSARTGSSSPSARKVRSCSRGSSASSSPPSRVRA